MEVHLRELFGHFQQQFGLGPGLGPGSGISLLKVDGISTAFIKAIFRALAALWRSHPWKRLKSSHHFGIRAGKDADWSNGAQPFSCAQFAGGGGTGDLGLNLFRTEQDALEMMGTLRSFGNGNLKCLPQRGLLRISFGPESELSPGNRKMIKTLGLEIAGQKAYPTIDVVYSNKGIADGFPYFRNPMLEELRWFYACLRALTQVHPMFQLVEGKPNVFETFAQNVDVSFPTEDLREKSVSVRVTFPPKDDQFEQISPLPKLAETIQDSSVELVDVPRQCVVCEKEVAADRAPRCSRCKALIYCSNVCQKQHWKEVHKVNCEQYKAIMERGEELEIRGFSFPGLMEHSCNWLESVGLHGKGMWRRICACYKHCPYGQLPPAEGGGLAGAWGVEHGKYPPDAPLLEFNPSNFTSAVVLSSWVEYYTIRALPLTSTVAVLLSSPLSLYNILTSLCIPTKNTLAKGKEVVVHYLGPDGELDLLPAFAEIGHLLNGAGSVHIIMIGPEVPSSISGEVTTLGRKLKVTFIQGLYQEEADSLQPPNVVVALNSGLETSTTWIGALEVVKAQGVPAYFTDYAEPCCENAKQVLRTTGLQITYPVTPNIFRSPVRNQMPSTNVPWYSNGFIFGVHT